MSVHSLPGCCFIVLLIIVSNVYSIPINLNTTNEKEDLENVFDFMNRFGYLDESFNNSGDKLSPASIISGNDAFKNVLRNIQHFGGINETGILDESTIKLIKSPRCGCPDILTSNRFKRYTLGPKSWNRNYITYHLESWGHKLDSHSVRQELKKAFKIWSEYVQLEFQEVSNKTADIVISFQSKNHGDGNKFDGPGGILAHAFYPGESGSLAGDIHFDNDEDWMIKSENDVDDDGINFFSVALHELGHSLGLAHSADKTSVMRPYYSWKYSESLGYDDIMGLYELYISKSHTLPKSRHSTTERSQTPLSTEKYTTPLASSTTYTQDHTSKKWNPTSPTRTSFTAESSKPPYDCHKEFPYHCHHLDFPNRNHHHFHHHHPDYDRRTTDHYKHVTRESTTEYRYVPKESTTEYRNVPKESTTERRRHVYESTTVTPSTTKNNANEKPNPCEIESFDAITEYRRELLVFKDKWLWRLRDLGDSPPLYPVEFRRLFIDLPAEVTKINAAYHNLITSTLVLFMGKNYWEFSGHELVSSGDLQKLGLPSHVNHIDAASEWIHPNSTLLFSGNDIWILDDGSHTVKPYDSETIPILRNIPATTMPLSSAFNWKPDVLNLVKGRSLWTLDENEYLSHSRETINEFIFNCDN